MDVQRVFLCFSYRKVLTAKCTVLYYHPNKIINGKIHLTALHGGSREARKIPAPRKHELGAERMKIEAIKNMTTMQSVLWHGIVLPGHEACRLFSQDSYWYLEGTAVFSNEQQPCHLAYQLICDNSWQTISAEVEGWLGKTLIGVQIKTNPAQEWWLNGVEQPDMKGCTDIDLNFSPSTNLLPIRRLNLAIGETAEVNAAWLRFPSFQLELLSQQYRRLDETTYRYESAGGQFVADLKVHPSGFVIEYPGLWQAEVIAE